VRGA
jgi:hypothetical protein